MNTKKEKTVKLKVEIDNHTHKGKVCEVGEEISVSESAAEMLKGHWAKIKEAQKEK